VAATGVDAMIAALLLTVALELPVLEDEATTLGLGGYPFVGNSEMVPFFWLAPGGANFLLCLL
jgi:hypothetical protein